MMTSCGESSDRIINKMKVEEKHPSCGLFNWRPPSLQRFVTYKYYVLVYIIISIAQSMVFSYLTVVLSTIEKQFGLKVHLTKILSYQILPHLYCYADSVKYLCNETSFYVSRRRLLGYILVTKSVKSVLWCFFPLWAK